MPDSRTGFTGTQVEAEPESSTQSRELAGHEIHLDGEARIREPLLFGPSVDFLSLLLADSTSRCLSDMDVLLGRVLVWRMLKDNHTLIW